MEDFLAIFVPAVTVLLIVTIFIFLCLFGVCYPASITEARLYNEKYATNYTSWDFFWAGESIRSFLNEGRQTTQNIKIEGSVPVTIK